jgi:hypothetical protein
MMRKNKHDSISFFDGVRGSGKLGGGVFVVIISLLYLFYPTPWHLCCSHVVLTTTTIVFEENSNILLAHNEFFEVFDYNFSSPDLQVIFLIINECSLIVPNQDSCREFCISKDNE